jgi:hypothetical protein
VARRFATPNDERNCAMSQAHPKSPAAQPTARNRRDAILVLLSFAMLLVSLDQYIVVVALPEIARDLGYSAQTLQSVVSAYAIASSGFLLFGGRASDLLGRRRVLVVGLFLYFAASLAGGLATNPAQQLAARALQGLGGALVFPSTLAIINVRFPEGAERNRALGIWAGAGAAGLVIGVLLGGALTSFFGWRAVFLVNVPLAGAALVAVLWLIETDGRIDRSRAFDLPGAVTVTAAISLLVVALVEGPNFGWLALDNGSDFSRRCIRRGIHCHRKAQRRRNAVLRAPGNHATACLFTPRYVALRNRAVAHSRRRPPREIEGLGQNWMSHHQIPAICLSLVAWWRCCR